MLVALVGMGLVGVVGLALSNQYAKEQSKVPGASRGASVGSVRPLAH